MGTRRDKKPTRPGCRCWRLWLVRGLAKASSTTQARSNKWHRATRNTTAQPRSSAGSTPGCTRSRPSCSPTGPGSRPSRLRRGGERGVVAADPGAVRSRLAGMITGRRRRATFRRVVEELWVAQETRVGAGTEASRPRTRLGARQRTVRPGRRRPRRSVIVDHLAPGPRRTWPGPQGRRRGGRPDDNPRLLARRASGPRRLRRGGGTGPSSPP